MGEPPPQRSKPSGWRNHLRVTALRVPTFVHTDTADLRLAANRIDGRNKPIAAAREGFDEPRRLSRIAQRVAEALHRRIQSAFEIDEGVVVPEPTPQLVPGDDLAGASE